jgi:S1-C subfamily serine protease
MKANRLVWFLLFWLVGAGFQLPAQQTEADRKWLAYIRAKAEKGDVAAQSNLGNGYLHGLWGLATNEVEGVKWIRKAAEQNDAHSQFWLGGYYNSGTGVEKDYVEAVRWFRKAAEHNLSQTNWDRAEITMARTQLGLSYACGDGVPKDYVEAYKWYLLAAGQDDWVAKQLIPRIEERMTREQIAQGQKLARDFKPREAPPAGGDSSAESIAQTRPEASGTGFFITEDGFLVTNEHVVKDATQIRLVTSMGLMSARVVKVDSANDLALLKAAGKFPALAVVSSRAVKMGSTVATVGFPNPTLQGFAPKLAKGEVAALSGAQDDPRYFQVGVPVQPGNSGGALVDERGNVVGVVSAKLSAAAAVATSGALPENVNYAVKSSFLLSFLESVPDVSAKLKEPNTRECKFEDMVKSAEKAAALVLVY